MPNTLEKAQFEPGLLPTRNCFFKKKDMLTMTFGTTPKSAKMGSSLNSSGVEITCTSEGGRSPSQGQIEEPSFLLLYLQSPLTPPCCPIHLPSHPSLPHLHIPPFSPSHPPAPPWRQPLPRSHRAPLMASFTNVPIVPTFPRLSSFSIPLRK